MTREGVIYEAANKYSESLYHSESLHTAISTENGFIAGAKWADKNPKSPWISVEDDLPFNHKELLGSSKGTTSQVFIRYDDGRYGFSCMAKIIDEWKWLNSWTKITHWMPIPKFKEDLL